MTVTVMQDADPFSQPVDAPRNYIRNGRYYLPPVDRTKPGYVGEGEVARTRVTTFAKILADNFALQKWEIRTTAVGLVLREDLYAQIAAVDRTGDPREVRDELDRLCAQAKEAAKGSEGANLGTAFHGFTEQVDQGKTPHVPEKWRAKIDAYGQAMRSRGLSTVQGWLERIVVNERYNLAGKFDRILRTHSGGLVIGDLKSQKTFWTWEEIAIQLAIYANADVMWDADKLVYEDMPDLDKSLAVVLWMPVVHPHGDPDDVDVFNLPLERAWNYAAETCERARIWRSESKHLGVLRPPVDLGLVETWARRLADASDPRDLSRVYQEAHARGQWTQELEAVGLARLQALREATYETYGDELLTSQRGRVE